MSSVDRFFSGLLFVLATLCLAGIVHILCILALPRLASSDAFTRLSAFVKPAGMTLLPRSGPDARMLPFADPAIARGACLFDLSKAALRLHGTVEEGQLTTFSFRTSDGLVFYSMTDRAAQRGDIVVLVLTQAQLDAIESEATDEEQPSQELRLVAPNARGIILVDALAALPGEWARAAHRVEQMTCESEPVAEE